MSLLPAFKPFDGMPRAFPVVLAQCLRPGDIILVNMPSRRKGKMVPWPARVCLNDCSEIPAKLVPSLKSTETFTIRFCYGDPFDDVPLYASLAYLPLSLAESQTKVDMFPEGNVEKKLNEVLSTMMAYKDIVEDEEGPDFPPEIITMDDKDAALRLALEAVKGKKRPVWTETLYRTGWHKAAAMAEELHEFEAIPNFGLRKHMPGYTGPLFQCLLGKSRCFMAYCVQGRPYLSGQVVRVRHANRLNGTLKSVEETADTPLLERLPRDVVTVIAIWDFHVVDLPYADMSMLSHMVSAGFPHDGSFSDAEVTYPEMPQTAALTTPTEDVVMLEWLRMQRRGTELAVARGWTVSLDPTTKEAKPLEYVEFPVVWLEEVVNVKVDKKALAEISKTDLPNSHASEREFMYGYSAAKVRIAALNKLGLLLDGEAKPVTRKRGRPSAAAKAHEGGAVGGDGTISSVLSTLGFDTNGSVTEVLTSGTTETPGGASADDDADSPIRNRELDALRGTPSRKRGKQAKKADADVADVGTSASTVLAQQQVEYTEVGKSTSKTARNRIKRTTTSPPTPSPADNEDATVVESSVPGASPARRRGASTGAQHGQRATPSRRSTPSRGRQANKPMDDSESVDTEEDTRDVGGDNDDDTVETESSDTEFVEPKAKFVKRGSPARRKEPVVKETEAPRPPITKIKLTLNRGKQRVDVNKEGELADNKATADGVSAAQIAASSDSAANTAPSFDVSTQPTHQQQAAGNATSGKSAESSHPASSSTVANSSPDEYNVSSDTHTPSASVYNGHPPHPGMPMHGGYPPARQPYWPPNPQQAPPGAMFKRPRSDWEALPVPSNSSSAKRPRLGAPPEAGGETMPVTSVDGRSVSYPPAGAPPRGPPGYPMRGQPPTQQGDPSAPPADHSQAPPPPHMWSYPPPPSYYYPPPPWMRPPPYHPYGPPPPSSRGAGYPPSATQDPYSRPPPPPAYGWPHRSWEAHPQPPPAHSGSFYGPGVPPPPHLEPVDGPYEDVYVPTGEEDVPTAAPQQAYDQGYGMLSPDDEALHKFSTYEHMLYDDIVEDIAVRLDGARPGYFRRHMQNMYHHLCNILPSRLSTSLVEWRRKFPVVAGPATNELRGVVQNVFLFTPADRMLTSAVVNYFADLCSMRAEPSS